MHGKLPDFSDFEKQRRATEPRRTQRPQKGAKRLLYRWERLGEGTHALQHTIRLSSAAVGGEAVRLWAVRPFGAAAT